MIAILIVGCLGLVGVVVAKQAPAAPGLQFLQVGHWVYNAAFQSAFHVDGSAGQVDARAAVPGAEPGSQVVQGDRSGYVVERSRITVFSKSTLTVENALTPPAPEQPAVLETPGGPYLVYRNAGQIVRLGDPVATVAAGGPLSSPVATGDGTLWVHRIDTGSLCELSRSAIRLACHAQLAQGHHGALSVVDDRPVLVDTTADTMRTVGTGGLGEPVALGTDLPPTAQVSSTATAGRIAVLDPDGRRLHLLDTAGLQKRPKAEPVVVSLAADGRFAGPVASAQVVALIDQVRNELLIYDGRGALKSATKIPGPDGTPPKLVRGEDGWIYLESENGGHVLVVNGEDGTVAGVRVGADGPPSNPGPAQAPPPAPPVAPPPAPPEKPQPPASPPPAKPSPPPPPPVARATPPGAPGGVQATAAEGSATLTWSPAAENGARVTAYRITWPGGSSTVDGSARRATVSGLANGTTHTITVAAQNSAGTGPGASATVTTPFPPAAAPAVNAQCPENWFGIRPITVSWTKPDLKGGTLVHYQVSVTGQADQTVTTESVEFNTMEGGTATVRAVTRFGSGANITGASGSDSFPAAAESGIGCEGGGGGGSPGGGGSSGGAQFERPSGGTGGFLVLIGSATLAAWRRKGA